MLNSAASLEGVVRSTRLRSLRESYAQFGCVLRDTLHATDEATDEATNEATDDATDDATDEANDDSDTPILTNGYSQTQNLRA